MTHLFSIEVTKNARTECRTCRNRIKKGVIRVGKITFKEARSKDSQVEVVSWHHLECIDKCPSSCLSDPSQFIRNFSSLDDSLKTSVTSHLASISVDEPVSSPSSCSTLNNTANDPIPSSNDPSITPPLPILRTIPSDFLTKLMELSDDDLNTELQLNNALTIGRRVDLIERVAEGRMFGRTEKCPKCKTGHLRGFPIDSLYCCIGNLETCSCGDVFKWDDIVKSEWKFVESVVIETPKVTPKATPGRKRRTSMR
ncbi:hypothetical protein RCL1_000344 [Eukaryota sp. TZLM3-RCL]